jgi:ArsR family transcriptional regulator
MKDRLRSTECARSLKALADPDRLKIIQCLQGGPKNVSQIAQLLRTEVANVSHHLGVLRHARLVLDHKEGKYVIYALNPEVFRAAAPGEVPHVADLGCCRLDLGGP